MLKRLLAVGLVVLFVRSDVAGAATTPVDNAARAKATITTIAEGQVIEVRMNDKRKIRGRLGSVRDAVFDVKYVEKGQVIERSFAYSDVKTVKTYRESGPGTKFLAGFGVGFLIFMAFGLIFVADRV